MTETGDRMLGTSRMLEGRTALVTGSGRGIGAAIARGLAQHGADVAINCLRDTESAQQVVADVETAGGRGIVITADVTDSAAAARLVEATREQLGPVDIVVHNALAGFQFDPRGRRAAWDLSVEDYTAQLNAAVGAAHAVTQAALPDLTGHGRGRVVSVLSDLIERPGVPYPEYVTAKSALLGWSRSMSAELGPLGVTVNCVAPGLVPSTGAASGTDDHLRDSLEAATPLRRLAEPEDVAGAVLAFASDWLGFVTGACLFVDGGLVMR